MHFNPAFAIIGSSTTHPFTESWSLMSENVATKNNPQNTAPKPAESTPEPKALTSEEISKRIDALPDVLKTMLKNLNESIVVHNGNVAKLTAAEKKDTAVIKADIFEQSKDPKLAKIREEYIKACEVTEKLKDQAYEHIDKAGLMPKELSEEEVTKLKTSTAESLKDVKAKRDAIGMFEAMSPGLELSPLITEIKSRRGTTGAKSAGTSGEIRRPRFKRIEINNLTEDNAGNKVYGVDSNGEPKWTFTFAAAYLKKQHKGISWTAKELQDTYYAGESDPDNMPEVKEFPMTHEYKDQNGNDQTVVYKIKAYRP